MRYLIVVISFLLVGCVVRIPTDGRLQLLCDRSIDERPQHLHCDRRFPVTVTWDFK